MSSGSSRRQRRDRALLSDEGDEYDDDLSPCSARVSTAGRFQVREMSQSPTLLVALSDNNIIKGPAATEDRCHSADDQLDKSMTFGRFRVSDIENDVLVYDNNQELGSSDSTARDDLDAMQLMRILMTRVEGLVKQVEDLNLENARLRVDLELANRQLDRQADLRCTK